MSFVSLFIYLFIYFLKVLFIYLFIYLWLCWVFVSVRGLSLVVASGATPHRGARASHYRGLSCCGEQAPDAQAQQLWLTGLVAPWHVGSSQTKARTRVPCIGRQTLNHCATREAPLFIFIYFGLRWVFVAARGLSLVVASGCYSFFSFFYLFIYDCVESSFLCEGFLQLRQVGATLHRGARASHCRGLSCCGAQAPDAQAQ